jgi:hypothetical protein
MGAWFEGGRIVDVILALVAVEIVALVALRRVHGAPLPGLVANLLAGAFLLIALRCALAGFGWPWIALSLLAALAAHVADLAARFHRSAR